MKPANLFITLIQTSLHWENVSANLETLSRKISSVKEKTDLIILPEMFSTGFTLNVSQTTEDSQGNMAIEQMKKWGAEKNCVITGSIAIKDKDHYYNRLIWMNPDGSFEQYDKRHLFSFSKEDTVYTAGDEKLIVELKGWKICPLVCYDLRFPVWSRNVLHDEEQLTADYDLLIYVANWPEIRSYAWKQLLIARAIENQSYVIGVNRVGEDGNKINYSGDSMVLDALGKVLYHKQNDEDIHTIELKFEGLKKIRSSFRFLKDADSFIVNPKSKIRRH